MALSEGDLAIYRHCGHLTSPGVIDAATAQALIDDIQGWGESFLAELPEPQRAWYVDGGVKARTVLRKLDNPHHHRAAVRELARTPALVEQVEAIIGRGVSAVLQPGLLQAARRRRPEAGAPGQLLLRPQRRGRRGHGLGRARRRDAGERLPVLRRGHEPRPGVCARSAGRRALQPAAACGIAGTPADDAGPGAARWRVLPPRQHLPPVGAEPVAALAPRLRLALRQSPAPSSNTPPCPTTTSLKLRIS